MRKRCWKCGKLVYPKTAEYFEGHLHHKGCVSLIRATRALWDDNP